MDDLELREQEQYEGAFRFVFDHSQSGWRYEITLVCPDGVAFAVASHIRRSQLSYEDERRGGSPFDDSFTGPWQFPQNRHGSGI